MIKCIRDWKTPSNYNRLIIMQYVVPVRLVGPHRTKVLSPTAGSWSGGVAIVDGWSWCDVCRWESHSRELLQDQEERADFSFKYFIPQTMFTQMFFSYTLFDDNNNSFLYHIITMSKMCYRVISILTSVLGCTHYYYFHFIGEETEAQQG